MRYPRTPNISAQEASATHNEDAAELDDEDLQSALETASRTDHHSFNVHVDDASDRSEYGAKETYPLANDARVVGQSSSEEVHITIVPVQEETDDHPEEAPRRDIESGQPEKSKSFVLPLPAVLASASIGFLCMLSAAGGSAENVCRVSTNTSRLGLLTLISDLQLALKCDKYCIVTILDWYVVHVHQVCSGHPERHVSFTVAMDSENVNSLSGGTKAPYITKSSRQRCYASMHLLTRTMTKPRRQQRLSQGSRSTDIPGNHT